MKLKLFKNNIFQSFTLFFFIFYILSKYSQTKPSPPASTIQIHGNATLGYYYIYIYIGSPAQRQSVIIDTGSGFLAVPCTKCEHCGSQHINPYYNLTMSRTNKIITCASQDQQVCTSSCTQDTDIILSSQPCRFYYYYQEGSVISGVYVQDYVGFNQSTNNYGVKVKFGCTTRESQLFFHQKANGILGLAPNRTGFVQKFLYNVFEKAQILKQYPKDKLTIAICLRNDGGFFNIGGSQKKFHPNIQPIITSFQGNFYYINGFTQIKIDDKIIYSIKNSYYHVIIDSGLTFTNFPEISYKILKQKLDHECNNQQNSCQIAYSLQNLRCYRLKLLKKEQINDFDVQNEVQKIFSPIIMTINNSKLVWRSSQYFFQNTLSENYSQVCLGVNGSGNIFKLGANWMINKDIVFNIQNHSIEIYQNSSCTYDFQLSMKQQQYIKVNDDIQSKLNVSKMIQFTPTIKHVAEYTIYWSTRYICGYIAILIAFIVQWINFKRNNNRNNVTTINQKYKVVHKNLNEQKNRLLFNQ